MKCKETPPVKARRVECPMNGGGGREEGVPHTQRSYRWICQLACLAQVEAAAEAGSPLRTILPARIWYVMLVCGDAASLSFSPLQLNPWNFSQDLKPAQRAVTSRLPHTNFTSAINIPFKYRGTIIFIFRKYWSWKHNLHCYW